MEHSVERTCKRIRCHVSHFTRREMHYRIANSHKSFRGFGQEAQKTRKEIVEDAKSSVAWATTTTNHKWSFLTATSKWTQWNQRFHQRQGLAWTKCVLPLWPRHAVYCCGFDRIHFVVCSFRTNSYTSCHRTKPFLQTMHIEICWRNLDFLVSTRVRRVPSSLNVNRNRAHSSESWYANTDIVQAKLSRLVRFQTISTPTCFWTSMNHFLSSPSGFRCVCRAFLYLLTTCVFLSLTAVPTLRTRVQESQTQPRWFWKTVWFRFAVQKQIHALTWISQCSFLRFIIVQYIDKLLLKICLPPQVCISSSLWRRGWYSMWGDRITKRQWPPSFGYGTPTENHSTCFSLQFERAN